MQEEEKYVDQFHRDAITDFRIRGLKVLESKSRIRYNTPEWKPFDWGEFIQELQFLLNTAERMIEYTERYYNELSDRDFTQCSDTAHQLLVRCSGFLSLYEDK